jgi:Protein of unknown function (DUF2568)
MRTTALLVRLVLEFVLFAGAAYAGWTLSDGGWRILFVILAPATLIAIWGLFLSPKARVTIPPSVRITLEALLFCGVSYLLWQAGAPAIGTALAAVWVLHRVVLALTAGTPSVLETGGRER